MTPLISVIIPCYNQGHFLSECIASLQGQTYVHWEAIIVDDGSPDDAARIATELASTDRRVVLVRQPNKGLSAARNTGLRYARGEYIQFLDADDLLLPGKFEAHLNIASISREQAATYTGYFDRDCQGPELRVNSGRLSCQLTMSRPLLDFSARWEHDLSIPIHAALFPRHMLDRLEGPFDENLPNHEDWDMWMRLACLEAIFVFIPEQLAVYRHGVHSMASNRSRMWSGFNLAIRKQLQLLQPDRESIRCLNYLINVNACRHSCGFVKWLRRVEVLGSSCLLPREAQISLSPKRHMQEFLRACLARYSPQERAINANEKDGRI